MAVFFKLCFLCTSIELVNGETEECKGGEGRGANNRMEFVHPLDFFLHLPQLQGQRLRESIVRRFPAVIGIYTNIQILLTTLYTFP